MIISLHWQVNKDLCCKNVPECQFFSSIFEEGQSVSQLRTRQVVVWARQMMQWLVWLTDTVTCLCPPTKATQCHMSLRKAPALSAPGLDPFHYNRFAVKSVASLNLQSVVESGLEMAQTGSQGYDTPLGCVREWVRQPACSLSLGRNTTDLTRHTRPGGYTNTHSVVVVVVVGLLHQYCQRALATTQHTTEERSANLFNLLSDSLLSPALWSSQYSP